MTPEEKAESLFKRMKSQMRGPGIEANEGNAKRCAIVCVEEMLDEAKGYNQPQRIEYWQQVLEILKAK